MQGAVNVYGVLLHYKSQDLFFLFNQTNNFGAINSSLSFTWKGVVIEGLTFINQRQQLGQQTTRWPPLQQYTNAQSLST